MKSSNFLLKLQQLRSYFASRSRRKTAAAAKADRVRDGTGESDEQLLQDALQAFNTAIEMDRESGLAWLGVARAKRLLKDTDGSSESLRRASRLLEDTDSSVAGEQALLALESGDLVAASQAIDLADINGETPLISYVRGNIAAREENSRKPWFTLRKH